MAKSRFGLPTGVKVLLYDALLLFAIVAFVGTCCEPVDASTVSPIQIEGNPRCADILGDLSGSHPPLTELKIDPPSPGTYKSGAFEVRIVTHSTAKGQTFDWEALFGDVYAVLAKGGVGGANLYDYTPAGAIGDDGLHAPLNPSGKWAGLSHITFCYQPLPRVPTAGGWWLIGFGLLILLGGGFLIWRRFTNYKDN